MSAFSSGVVEKINHELGRYESKRSSILPILHAIQDEYGYVSDEQVEELHEKYDLNRVQVREVITFYSLYRTTPPAKYEILFCNSPSCDMMGAEPAIDKIEARIKAYKDKGQESPFGVEGVPCLGVCDGAPAMLVNKEKHLKVTSENVDKILDEYAPL